ncbi:MAG: class I tRNA ligase family protein [Actinomycetota bacterium]
MNYPPTFVSADVEGPLYEKWVKAGYFTPDSSKPPFTIVIPPPNVNGSLHIGHALDHTIQDILIRMKRMKGFAALWLPGMDHAGIAMQNAVEETTSNKRVDASRYWSREICSRSLGLEKGIRCQILGQMRRLGDSVDWTRERFTMDEGLSKAVITIIQETLRSRFDLSGRANH